MQFTVTFSYQSQNLIIIAIHIEYIALKRNAILFKKKVN